MKNLIYLFLAGALALGSCGKDDPRPIAVGSVTLDKSTLTLVVGQQTTLKATVTPDNAEDKTITWRSSAPTIATVSDAGVVTAIAEGSATITATGGGIGDLQRECRTDYGRKRHARQDGAHAHTPGDRNAHGDRAAG